MHCYSSFTLHVSPKNPISAEKLKITLAKIQILPPKLFFLNGLVQNQLKLYVFERDFMTNQLKLTVPKKFWFRSWKGSNIWTQLYTNKYVIKMPKTSLKRRLSCGYVLNGIIIDVSLILCSDKLFQWCKITFCCFFSHFFTFHILGSLTCSLLSVSPL